MSPESVRPPLGKVLVTGATSFLGYHAAKQLNAQGIRPRILELAGSNVEPLKNIDVERCDGHVEDNRALNAALAGVDTALHLAFKVSVRGGSELLEQMRRVNVAGTARLLDAAAASGVKRVVVASSALAIGVNRKPVPLDETASWAEHAFDLPYAVMRRQVEGESLARTKDGFDVIAVCPAFTLGPDDPVGAPANTLLKTLITGKLRVTLPVGFGCLDVRDFATGVVRAAERGIAGQRYLLSGHNVTANEFLQQAAAIAGVRAPRFQPPAFLLHTLVAAVEVFSKLRRKPAPISRDVLQVLGRYAWYDTTRARSDLGWEPRPLQQTLEDTIRWLQDR